MVYLLSGSKEIPESYIAQLLLKQNTLVKVLANTAEDKKYYQGISPELQIVEGSLEDVFSLDEALSSIDMVIHSNMDIKEERFEKMRHSYVEKTTNLVNLCLLKTVKLCYIGSVLALGVVKKQVDDIDENFKWENQPLQTDRHRIANLAETEVWRGIEEGLEALIINSTLCLSPKLDFQGSLSAIKKNGQLKVSYTDVRDLAAATLQLLDANEVNKKVIVDTGKMPLSKFTELNTSSNGSRFGLFQSGKQKLLATFGIENLIDINYKSKHPLMQNFQFRSMEDTCSWISPTTT
ncbi:hypothetical protein R9C00_03580 [Flammeovirgaceae bacterium SG7u.111]|nr:hypothetical protein [Flammeovirgaceae bacterium SG7u.132]WPO36525.1 hypothetical protein R9C00_03580 [Flammeovirgaceae bacterium SG7u.111]